MTYTIGTKGQTIRHIKYANMFPSRFLYLKRKFEAKKKLFKETDVFSNQKIGKRHYTGTKID